MYATKIFGDLLELKAFFVLIAFDQMMKIATFRFWKTCLLKNKYVFMFVI